MTAPVLTDLGVTDIVAELYAADKGDGGNWDDILWPEADDGVTIALRRVGPYDVLVPRGSITPEDWGNDAMSFLWRESHDHPTMGHLPLGFYRGLETAYAHMAPLVREGALVLGGHSLGAARALELGGMFAADGKPPIMVIALAPPRPGMKNLRDAYNHIPKRLYWNRHDPVPTQPPDPPFKHAGSFTYLAEPAEHPLDPFGAHHIALYRAGVAKVNPAPFIPLPA